MPLPFSLSQLGAESLESRMGIRDSMRACCMAMVEGTGLYFWTLLAIGYGYRATAPDCSERAWSMRLGGAPRTIGTRDPGPGTISVRPGSGTMVPASLSGTGTRTGTGTGDGTMGGTLQALLGSAPRVWLSLPAQQGEGLAVLCTAAISA